MTEKETYSVRELMATVISREVEDGDSLQCGANAVVERAGMLLGHLHHGPNCRILIGRTYSNLYETPVLQLYDSNTDIRAARWGEYVIPHDESFSFSLARQITLFSVSALQVDPHGNTNMIGIGRDLHHLKVRGPGGVGTTPTAAVLKRHVITLHHHERRVLVEDLDFRSGVGYGDGPDFRRRMSLPEGGPRICVTPLCVFDFDDDTKKMRIASIHPGVELEEILANTGFDPIVPESVPVTPVPTEEELSILRGRIDPVGRLRGGRG
jgi:glutaconate CoA-transferase subunit B